MENTIVAIFVVLALIIGGVAGAVITPNDTEIQTVYEDKIVEKIVEVPVEVVTEAPSQLELAVEAFMRAVEDEEDEAGNAVDLLGDYYFDEISINKIYDDYVVTYDGDKITVDFSIKLLYDDGDDRVKETYDVKVVFEEGEDTEVTVA